MDPLLLRPCDAAALLGGIHEDTLAAWERRGLVRAIRQGRIVLYSPAALAEDVAAMLTPRVAEITAAPAYDVPRIYSQPERYRA